ncbi:hypothetical protein SAE01_43960 [Segetibacter aerophilus]|uniref:Uncharacterized protein n=1 Tax=Segetibacter aerophilus TaxID=670293 RepID=A0A512BIW2_9BACT|nr:hypothetical protein SAE01_43960 [Segetibacter aerophilus]
MVTLVKEKQYIYQNARLCFFFQSRYRTGKDTTTIVRIDTKRFADERNVPKDIARKTKPRS